MMHLHTLNYQVVKSFKLQLTMFPFLDSPRSSGLLSMTPTSTLYCFHGNKRLYDLRGEGKLTPLHKD